MRLLKPKNYIIIIFILFFGCFFDYLFFTQAQTSPDAIALRIIPNPDYYSALRWYKDQNFTGSPQSLTVDGYEAVRDGRTVYVNAANVNLGASELYANIYIISYNQEAEKATRDIFSQILSHWAFNTNLAQGETFSGTSSVCSRDNTIVCLTDEDCLKKGYCNSAKAQVTRDTIRLSRLYDIDRLIRQYGKDKGEYPKLSAGTYLPNITISTWPSWQNVLAQVLKSKLPVDPINKLIDCGDPRFHPITCWDEKTKEFAWISDIKNGGLPPGNQVFLYKYGSSTNENEYTLCAMSETGMFPDPAKMCNSGCIPACYGKECGDDGCGGDCGTCPSGQTCQDNKCFIGCASTDATHPGCQNSLDHAHAIAGFCPGGGHCYECDLGWHWDNVSGQCECTPDCTCQNNTCVGSTCQDGCGGTCPGIKAPDCSCAAVTCAGNTCSDGCGGECEGALACSCVPDCSCESSTCRGSICVDPVCGTPCPGQLDCSAGCVETCASGPGCRAGLPNGQLTGGVCCTSGEYCYTCLDDYAWTGTQCVCSSVSVIPISDTTIYAYEDYTGGTGVPVFYRAPTRYDDSIIALSGADIVSYGLSIDPAPPANLFISYSYLTGDIHAVATNNDAAGDYDITVTATNACGQSDSTSFTLHVRPNEWCGDGIVNGGEDCDNISVNCSAIDGGWSAWSGWSACSDACSGLVTRSRTCTNPAPLCGGAYCVGNNSENEWCTTVPTATLRVSADDAYDAYFNGVYLGSQANWNLTGDYSVSIQQGENVIAIRGRDISCYWWGVSVMLNRPGCLSMTTNNLGTWKCTASKPGAGWMNIDYNDSSWPNAVWGNPGTAGSERGYVGNALDVGQIWAAGAGCYSTIYCRYSFGS